MDRTFGRSEDDVNRGSGVRQGSLRALRHPALRIVGGVMLIGASLWLLSTGLTELVDSFSIHRGYEVGLGRVAAAVFFLIAVATAYLGVRLIRSSASHRRKVALTTNSEQGDS